MTRDAAVYRLQRVWRDLTAGRAELAQAGALLAGWALVTYAVAQLLPRGQVWPLSAGLLLLSFVGWEFLGTIARHGLYELDRKAKGAKVPRD